MSSNALHSSRGPARLALIALVGLLMTTVSCGYGDDGRPLLSYLLNQRMTLVLKGTYATDNPLSCSQINSGSIFQNDKGNLDVGSLPSYCDLPIYIDFGEVRLSTRNPFDPLISVTNNDAAIKFWDVATADRQVYCSQLYGLDPENDSCRDTGGLAWYQEFMNGNGAIYPSRDVGPGVYLHAGIFIRAIATGYARDDGNVVVDRFDNNEIIGQNILQNVNYDPGIDTASKQIQVPQFFPLHHIVNLGQESTLVLDNTYTPAVLEIRSNLLENLMVHSYQNASGRDQTIVAFSDWRREHDNEFDMGGNVLTRGRIYYPELSKDVVVSGGVENSSIRHYYALYVLNEDNKTDQLPIAATPVRNGSNRLRDLMPGPYVLQCRYDCQHDGYPEEIISETTFQLGGNGFFDHNISLTCGDTTPATGCN